MKNSSTTGLDQQWIPWWQVNFGPQAAKAAQEEILAGRISMGKTTQHFEKTICQELNVRFCVATSSGTTALLMALMALNIKPGDVVAVQDRSWISPAHAAHLLNANLLLIDVSKEIPVVDFKHFLKVIKRKPKVVVIVHMNGRSENIKRISDECSDNGISLIEDAAQAIGSKNDGHFLGTVGDIGCFSLAISKTVSSGQGGFCVTNNPNLYEKLLSLRTHGTNNVFDPKWSDHGMNFRYTDPQAAIALDQLQKLPTRIEQQHLYRQNYVENFRKLGGIKMNPIDPDSGQCGPYFDAWTHNGAEVKSLLKDVGVESRRYYPPIASANYLRIENRNEIVNAAYWHEHGLVLPSGPNLSVEQLDYVTNASCKVLK